MNHVNREEPRCIKCGRKKCVVARGGGQFWCNHCRILFDDNPEEGGTHCTGNPAGRLEREERRRERTQDRVGRR